MDEGKNYSAGKKGVRRGELDKMRGVTLAKTNIKDTFFSFCL
jgi:hypothetical protein